jgi:hypothetical protein
MDAVKASTELAVPLPNRPPQSFLSLAVPIFDFEFSILD